MTGHSSASMSCPVHVSRVAVQLKLSKAASKTNRQTVTHTKINRVEDRTTSFVAYGCESAQQLSVTVCLHKADVE